jgi:hypothetical protein
LPEVLTREPTEIVAGDTVKWNLPDLTDYPIADGWAVSYALRGSEGYEIRLGAEAITQSVTHHAVVISAERTAQLLAGHYTLTKSVSKSGERYTLQPATEVVVRDDPARVVPQSHDSRMLAAIEAALEGRVTADTESFQINGRAINQIPIEKLRVLRGEYELRVDKKRYGDSPIRYRRVGFVNR